jgi:hypothetical protein
MFQHPAMTDLTSQDIQVSGPDLLFFDRPSRALLFCDARWLEREITHRADGADHHARKLGSDVPKCRMLLFGGNVFVE